MHYLDIILVLAIYLVGMRIVDKTVARIGSNKSVNAYRISYISRTINLALTAAFFVVTSLLLGFEYRQLAVFLSSAFAVLGVALFAQWSILSNITASLIIFFAFPYRVGDTVRVVDKDDDISGVIEEISLFHVIIRRGVDYITYPNSLILQKAVIKLKKEEPKIDEE